MNTHHSPLDAKLAAIARRNSQTRTSAAQDGVGRALMTVFPAVRQHRLPEDMKRLLTEIGWQDQESAI